MRALLLLLVLTGCDASSPDTEPANGSAADTDTDTDTDTVPASEPDCSDGVDNDLDGATDCADSDCVCIETGCTDGADDDLDGLIDCEDSDCLDACTESCGDGADNDLDGATDCDDDECYGVDSCGGPYALELAHSGLALAWAWQLPVSQGYSAPFGAYLRSTATVTATPSGDWGGEAFDCEGAIAISLGLSSADAGARYDGALTEGYLATLGAQTADASLRWSGEGCPIAALPALQLRFLPSGRTIDRNEGGFFTPQYVPEYIDDRVFEDSQGEVFYVRYLLGVSVDEAPSWSGVY